MSARFRGRGAMKSALLFILLASCAPNAARIRTPKSFDYFCGGSKQVNLSGMQSVLTSTDDRVSDEHPSAARILSVVRRQGGAIAYWDDQVVKLPRLSVAFGETDGFLHVRKIAVPTPLVDELQHRMIYVNARDHGVYRWIGMQAFDVQDVCVEGHRRL